MYIYSLHKTRFIYATCIALVLFPGSLLHYYYFFNQHSVQKKNEASNAPF